MKQEQKYEHSSAGQLQELPNVLFFWLLAFLATKDYAAIAAVSSGSQEKIEEYSKQRITLEFKRTIPQLPFLLKYLTIYHHLEIWSQMDFAESKLYDDKDPALLQSQLIDESKTIDSDLLLRAAGVGNGKLVMNLLHQISKQWEMGQLEKCWENPDLKTQILEKLACSGNLPLFKMFLGSTEQLDFSVLSPVLQTVIDEGLGDYIAVVEWLTSPAGGKQRLNPHPESGRPRHLRGVIHRDRLPMMRWMISNDRGDQRSCPNQHDLEMAAEYDSIRILELLTSEDQKEQRLFPDQKTLDEAVGKRSLAAIRWLTSENRGKQRLYPTQRTLDMARHIARSSGNTELICLLEGLLNHETAQTGEVEFAPASASSGSNSNSSSSSSSGTSVSVSVSSTAAMGTSASSSGLFSTSFTAGQIVKVLKTLTPDYYSWEADAKLGEARAFFLSAKRRDAEYPRLQYYLFSIRPLGGELFKEESLGNDGRTSFMILVKGITPQLFSWIVERSMVKPVMPGFDL